MLRCEIRSQYVTPIVTKVQSKSRLFAIVSHVAWVDCSIPQHPAVIAQDSGTARHEAYIMKSSVSVTLLPEILQANHKRSLPSTVLQDFSRQKVNC
jgi:hypothetical protein